MKYLAIISLFIITGCAALGIAPPPSVCDAGPGDSVICSVCGEMGTTPEENPMGIRQKIAGSLIVAANAVAKDQSKERIQKWVHDSRVKIAKAIEPKG